MNDAYDVVVVGSGPIGTAIARELADLDASLTIAVLEAGAVLGDVPGGHVKNIADDAARDAGLAALDPGAPTQPGGSPARPGTALLGTPDMPNAAISTNVGGMGAHWTAACPRPDASEIADFVDRSVLDEALTRGEELLHVTTHAFDSGPMARAVQKALGVAFDTDARRPVGPMPLAVGVTDTGALYWTGPEVVAGDLWSRENVTLHQNTKALRVVMDGGRATGVDVVDTTSGARRTIGARAVAVAADAFRTPQLLWASGVRPEALGRYLNDQPQVMCAALLDEKYLPSDDELAGATGQSASTSGVAGTEIIPLSGVSWVPLAGDRPFHGQVMQMDASPVKLDPGISVRPGQVVGLGWFCCKEGTAADRVWFDDTDTDAHGLPAIRVDYHLTPADEQALADAKTDIAKAANAVGRQLDEPFVMPAGSSLHYQGSTRVGPVDDGTSVADLNSRVWGTENLWVGGNNVIPSPTACNPTLTAVAFGVLAARDIAARLGAATAKESP